MKIKANDICGNRGEKCYSSIFLVLGALSKKSTFP